ncbi:MAG: PAS domain-containing protein [Spirochaetota bacterium]
MSKSKKIEPTLAATDKYFSLYLQQKHNEAEQAVFQNAKIWADYLAVFLGDYCEIVIHSVRELEHSVIYIVNGHISGRRSGAPITDLGLKILQQFKNRPHDIAPAIYRNYNKQGSPMRSTTMPLLYQRELLGFLCINLSLEMPLANLGDLFSSPGHPSNPIESLMESHEALLASMLNNVLLSIDRDSSISSKYRNKAIVNKLLEQNFFELKSAVSFLSNALKVSSDTIYMHIRQAHGPGKKTSKNFTQGGAK